MFLVFGFVRGTCMPPHIKSSVSDNSKSRGAPGKSTAPKKSATGTQKKCNGPQCTADSTTPKAGTDGFDHINRNPPVLIRTPKLTRFEPAQYWGGGPPGNSVVLNP